MEEADFETAWKVVAGSVKNKKDEEAALAEERSNEEVRVKLAALKVKQKRASVGMVTLEVDIRFTLTATPKSCNSQLQNG